MIDSTKQGYKNAFKATSLLGGVQVITILIGIARSKCIALWLGPSGFGVMSLFNSVITLISSISNLGLASSAVRDISKTNNQENGTQLAHTIKAINRCVILTGLFGSVLTVILSYYLSKYTFGSSFYTQSFILLSIVVFFNGLYSGDYATLQGLRKLSSMGKARIWGSFLGTSITLPLFYFYKENGIVPALITTSFITYIVSWLYVRQIKITHVKQSLSESFRIGKTTIKLGIMMAITAISVSIVEFLVKTFIVRIGGAADVGLYQAGWNFNAQYLGLVFTAMATDYFPKLSSISHDNKLINKNVNEQAEIAILILGPMIAMMLVLMPYLIRMLYSVEFMEIVPMARWLMFGSVIKAGSWAISFVFLAKGDGKTFLFNELGIKCITIPSYFLGYYLGGITGIGYAFTLNYIIYFIWVVLVANRKYELSYSHVFVKLLSVQVLFLLMLIFLEIYVSGVVVITLSIIIVVLVLVYSFKNLNERLEITSYIKNKIGRK